MTGLYVHIPFCLAKCPYCDFFSLPGREEVPRDYVELLLSELRLHAPSWSGPFDTLFFGGGTPSLLTPAQLERLLRCVRETYGLTENAEITLEANPGTVTPASLDGYRQAGINRLSFGVQSFDDRFLEALGRRHTANEALTAFRNARSAGFSNLSVDLIFGLPGQNQTDLDRDLDALLELAPEHVSTYGLTLEEGTPLHRQHQRQPLPLPDDELSAAFYLHIDRRLSTAGYQHYEISNYARPGYACRHNLATWDRQPYLGIGAGAHSFRDIGWGERLAAPADLAGYADALHHARDPAERLERFDREAAMSETLYLGLRTAAGVAEDAFAARFGVTLGEVFGAARRHCGERLQTDAGRWRLDLEGWLLYDHLIQHFFQ